MRSNDKSTDAVKAALEINRAIKKERARRKESLRKLLRIQRVLMRSQEQLNSAVKAADTMVWVRDGDAVWKASKLVERMAQVSEKVYACINHHFEELKDSAGDVL